RKGCLVLRTELMLDLWETDQFIEDGTLSTLVSRLRQKLKQACGNGVILTAKGKGYYIE
ncbi:helix-turn-helix domain-containing protein, partial [uncultured Dubosiella sp.]